ncbi:MAG: sigma-70 family RNA polymerase sigma factor [Bacteroidales bacterium]|jgi:RNA polymerase sigma-70 factor (ECF subfamily)|nr:sigma-70 family RNA polymerase sigma factor [Bacteroidales bacterium]
MKTIDKRSDYELVQAYVSGEKKVFDTLVRRHQQKLYNYINSVVKDKDAADDIFQDTFIKVVNVLRGGTYREEGKFLQWIMRIAHNLIIDYFRKEQKIKYVRSNDEVDVFDMLGNFEDSQETRLIKKQIDRDLRNLVKQLPEEQRRVLIMRHYADMSFKEIAERTGVSINTALGRMRYALLNIRKMAEEKSLILSI